MIASKRAKSLKLTKNINKIIKRPINDCDKHLLSSWHVFVPAGCGSFNPVDSFSDSQKVV